MVFIVKCRLQVHLCHSNGGEVVGVEGFPHFALFFYKDGPGVTASAARELPLYPTQVWEMSVAFTFAAYTGIFCQET